MKPPSFWHTRDQKRLYYKQVCDGSKQNISTTKAGLGDGRHLALTQTQLTNVPIQYRRIAIFDSPQLNMAKQAYSLSSKVKVRDLQPNAL